MEINSQIVINKPVEVVWEYFTDPGNLAKWMSGLKKVEHKEGTPGETGAVSKHTLTERGQEIIMDVTITDKVEPEKLSLQLEHKDFKVKVLNLLEPVDSKTTAFATNADVKIKSFAYKLMAPVIKTELKNKQDKDLNNLKREIERL